MAELTGKVALVTGGSRGIGAAIAKQLAHDGADVALTYVNGAESARGVVKEIEVIGRSGVAIQADAADGDAVVAAVEMTVKELGSIDILVANAGIFPNGPLAEVTRTELDRTLAIHTSGVFLAAQAAARHMGHGGRVIGIGSDLAERVAMPGIALYAMSKSALSGLVKGLARDLGPRGITANVVHPGSTDTDMNPSDGPSADAQRGFTALGHYAEAGDIAATVAHLASDAGRYITGTSITVDGGFTA